MEKKTSRELADMIATRINIGGVMVKVHPDPAYGWHATVLTAPTQAIRCQQVAEEVAAELRAKYELRDPPGGPRNPDAPAATRVME
jgi:hypothetical protein